MYKTEKELKQKILNSVMISGNKTTSEKILLKTLKLIQKKSNNSYIELLKQCIIRTTPTFKINKQILKKGKRKTKLETPSFIKSESNRITLSLKLIVSTVKKKQELKTFHKKFSDEIILNYSKSKSVDYKNEIQKQVLMKKRYIHKFRW